jgi:DNA-binding IscR family transcriptional regulator
LRQVHFSPALNAKYALSLLARIGRRFYEKAEPYTLGELSEAYEIPSHVLESCLVLLVELGILAETDDPESRFVPAVPLDATTVVDVLQQIDTFQPGQTYSPPLITEPSIVAIDQASNEGRVQALSGLTLKQLALSDAGEVSWSSESLPPHLHAN